MEAAGGKGGAEERVIRNEGETVREEGRRQRGGQER